MSASSSALSKAMHAPVLRPRQADWERCLVQWAESRVGTPFAWGVCDCAHLAAEALAAMTLTPIDAILAGLPRYATKVGAARVSIRVGGTRARLEALGLTAVRLAYAQTGDIVVTPDAPFAHAFVVVRGLLLGVHPGDVVRWYPMAHALETSVAVGVRAGGGVGMRA